MNNPIMDIMAEGRALQEMLCKRSSGKWLDAYNDKYDELLASGVSPADADHEAVQWADGI